VSRAAGAGAGGADADSADGADGAGGGAQAASRAARLLRCYPRAWRDRYGDEFAELLISDIEERPRSAARTLDVIRGGALARFAVAGLCGVPIRETPAGPAGPSEAGPARRHLTASLVTLECGLAVFLWFAAAMWSQLTIGWEWASTAGTAPVAALATRAISVAMPALLAIAVLAALPVIATVALRVASGRAAGLLWPSAVLVAAAAIVFTGGRHFGNGWPGTGGHDGLIPGGVAAFGWATTLSDSSYWAHQGALLGFPAAEVAWMAVSPLALIAIVASAVVIVRRTELPLPILAFETRLAAVACPVMVVILAGCGCWVATEGQSAGGQPGLFHAGLIDVAGIAVLALALGVAVQAARTASRSLRLTRPPA
jgi:hypothetical protein